MLTRKMKSALVIGLFFALTTSYAFAGNLPPFGQAVTYQGELSLNGQALTDSCDFRLDVWTSQTGGSEIDGSTASAVPVVDGRFTAQISCTDEDCFNGDPRWLEIEVRCPAGSGTFTTLSPRQEITPAPYAVLAAEVPIGSITSAEIADSTIQAEDVDGGLLNRKTQLYRRTASTAVSTIGQHGVIVSCDGPTDIAIESGCNTSGPSSVRLANIEQLDWESESAPAAVRCTYYNTINFGRFIGAEILCIDVP